MAIAVFGAAFDPPHLGHIDVLKQIQNEFDRIILVPSAAHAFGKQMTDFDHRVTMCQLILEEQLPKQIGKIEISEIERRLAQPSTPVYTWDVLNALHEKHPTQDLTFVMGPDNAENWSKFYRHDEIEKAFTVKVVEQRVPVRSTLCRALPKNLPKFVGPAVADYLAKTGLYQGAPA